MQKGGDRKLEAKEFRNKPGSTQKMKRKVDVEKHKSEEERLKEKE